MEEILCAIGATIFSIVAVICGVKRRFGNSKLNSNRGIYPDRSGYNDLVSDCERLERDKERLRELDRRDDANIKRCSEISERIRKREPETDTAK